MFILCYNSLVRIFYHKTLYHGESMGDFDLITPKGEVITDLGDAVEQATIAKLMTYMVENNIHNFSRACKDLGLVPRTVKRWLAKPENTEVVRSLRTEEISAAADSITGNIEAIAAEQVRLALNASDARDRTRAATWCQRYLELHGHFAGEEGRTDAKNITPYHATFELTGPVTLQMQSARKEE